MASAAQGPHLAILKASYDYDPEPDAEEELHIKENQLLFLLERTDDDWWKVQIIPDSQEEEGASGLVPSAYVEPADHISVVKVLYDYEAAQSTELSVKEDEILYVYGKDEAWLLVQSQSEGGGIGYVPENYVEEITGEGESSGEAAPAAQGAFAGIVVPPSPPRPVSTYVDPADRVALASVKAQADDIQTWVLSEVDKKGKKKKGTLGVGNGSIFFASESDKTPVQKWQTASIQSVRIEKSKHIHIEVGGAEPLSLHFHGGSKDVAEAVVAKVEASRALAAPRASVSSEVTAPSVAEVSGGEIDRPRSAQRSVHFDAGEPEIIPPREPSEAGDSVDQDAHEHEEPDDEIVEGESAVVLYDFTADGEDELSVQEGETLLVLERDSDEWWKCRNAAGAEGVVPASYVEVVGGSRPAVSAAVTEPDEDTEAALRSQRAADARAEADRQAAAKAREQAERERAEKERKRREAEQRAKAAAAAAEADKKRREHERELQKEKERAAAEEEERKKRAQRDAASDASASRSSRKPNGDSTSSRSSIDRRGPPPENTRVWHDRSGQFRVEAAFLGFSNDKLRLHKVNGVVIEVPKEKMSAEDLRYVEKLLSKKTSPARKSSDDDEPLAIRRQSLQPEAMRANAPPRTSSAKKAPTIDWFEFFLNAGCDVDDCSRYATSFERDKIDETILADITESTMRSLGLREGDIIRVKKAIDQKYPKTNGSANGAQDQLRRDEELAKQLQAEEDGGRAKTQAPNLFAGPNGALKNNVRRGRPQPSKSLPPSSVDLKAITTASDQIQRSGSPMVASPETLISTSTPPPATQAPARSSSTVPVASGFDDDAWTNRPTSTRPSSTKPLAPTPPAPTPPAIAPRAPSAPPAPPPPPAPPAPVAPPAQIAPAFSQPAQVTQQPPAQPERAQSVGAGTSAPAKTDNDIFDQLARLSALRPQNTSISPLPPRAASAITTPAGYQSGMGMGNSPVPLGQHLQAQQTGLLPSTQASQFTNGPRGPFAPVPANQSLLQPLIPTTTGFNSFVPTRPQSANPTFQPQQPSFQPQQPSLQPQQPSFLSAQPTGFQGPSPTGFQGPSPSLAPQITGFPSSGPLLSQPTGFAGSPFGNQNGGFSASMPSFQSTSPFGQPQNTNSFNPIQPNPTGFNPGFGQSPYNNGISSPPPAPAPAPNTSPANVFAQMKSGTFANDNAPQGADKYDALRPNPVPLTTQPTGWGYTGMNGGYQGGFGYQR